MKSSKWKEAQKWEGSWWGNCTNTISEEMKQFVYSEKMGLKWSSDDGKIAIDVKGKSIMDIGGGPVSMLLKVINSPKKCVVDPCHYPEWVIDRYLEANIFPSCLKGEELIDIEEKYDEVWIYNCLQHVDDPKLVIENAKRMGKTIRLFEWIEIDTNIGHLHRLKAQDLQEWLGGKGSVSMINSNGCNGLAYYGVFNYEK